VGRRSKKRLRDIGVCEWEELESYIDLLEAPSRLSLLVPGRASTKKRRGKFVEVAAHKGRETRATHDFFAGIESPGLRNASANFGHFDVLRILKT
jgi:hypothetical protein